MFLTAVKSALQWQCQTRIRAENGHNQSISHLSVVMMLLSCGLQITQTNGEWGLRSVVLIVATRLARAGWQLIVRGDACIRVPSVFP